MQKPVALFSQGIGPLTNPELRSSVRRLLPQVHFIGLREGMFGPEILRDFGVPTERVCVTGDDAIEMVCDGHRQEDSKNLGVCLRVSRSSQISREFVPDFQRAIVAIARHHEASLVPVPIEPADAALLRQVVGGPEGHFNSVEECIDQAGKCRVLVTAAYHAAVFALSQGRPVVCIENSHYFRQKFEGLAYQFGRGCLIVSVSGTDWSSRLAEAVQQQWESADKLRDPLLRRASEQRERSRAAYRNLRGLPSAGVHNLRVAEATLHA
jgi:polysaccharide pyruvyl transferase WcaK-like protein